MAIFNLKKLTLQQFYDLTVGGLYGLLLDGREDSNTGVARIDENSPTTPNTATIIEVTVDSGSFEPPYVNYVKHTNATFTESYDSHGSALTFTSVSETLGPDKKTGVSFGTSKGVETIDV